MSIEKNEINTAVELINKHFQIEDTKLQISSDIIGTDNILKENLFRLIRYLLENNFERLLTGMYRIDVPENKFNEAMETGKDFDEIAEKITILVLEREMEKVRYRNRNK